ncbi:MAG: Asp-tRNA(Asn)/Glu-tRNA(Gln) amidotransferase subunit GatC [Planctomycetaceae bacterium]
MLNREDVEKVAGLARLKLTDAEIAAMTEKLGRMIDYVTVLDGVDVAGIEPMAHVADVANVFREDSVRDSLSREDALANAPATDGRFFLVPQILENA